MTVPMDVGGALSPTMISLAPDTKAEWKRYHDAIECELRPGGELYDVQDVASKTADNATRIATLFQIFEHGLCRFIGLEAFEGASRIAAWHLNESRRFFGDLALPEEQANAARLDQWLIGHCWREKSLVLPRREIQRHITPVRLRQKETLNKALAELEEADRVWMVVNGRRKDIHVNPALLNGDIQ